MAQTLIGQLQRVLANAEEMERRVLFLEVRGRCRAGQRSGGAPPAEHPDPAAKPMPAIVKGFGCRPDHDGGAGHAGRRRKASRGGNRGPTSAMVEV
ncbi:hypothetical protein K9U40_08195, partial [Xanthobacter autotrophicus]|uniref:hypothetical protein n=1 Tax=Xanthobacter autotrophicus TaxID=280 RepID=UPI0024AC1751